MGRVNKTSWGRTRVLHNSLDLNGYSDALSPEFVTPVNGLVPEVWVRFFQIACCLCIIPHNIYGNLYRMANITNITYPSVKKLHHIHLSDKDTVWSGPLSRRRKSESHDPKGRNAVSETATIPIGNRYCSILGAIDSIAIHIIPTCVNQRKPMG